MKKYPKVSIIIPVYKLTDYFYESLEKCLKLDYPNYEILIGVDHGIKIPHKDPRIRILKTHETRTGPAEKRDIGIVKAKGEVIAFLDDDSFPDRNWLKKAVQVLQKEGVSSVCGPGLTPPKDSFSQKITGAILESPFGSGPYFYRFKKGSPRYVDDYPAYNMFVRRDVLLKVGGFGTKFYGGEDTAICIKLINAGEKIYYHPDIIVYHHRRKFPGEYIRQVGNVGLHRGYFVKKYPQTSLRFTYFAPAVLIVLFIGLSLLLLFRTNQIFVIYIVIATISGYISLVLFSLKSNSLKISMILPLAIFLHHAAYGIQFLKGLSLVKKLDR